MKRQLLAAAALIVALSVGILVGVVATPAGMANPTLRIKPCLTEDGSGPAPCLWDAKTRGNGQGRSFISPRGDADGERIYLD